MVIETFRFEGEHATPVDLDSEQLETFLGATWGPSVVVLRLADLVALLREEPARRYLSSLRTQHEKKALGSYFHGKRSVALAGKYADLVKLKRSVASFLAQAIGDGERAIHFLGVTSALFGELAKQSRMRKPAAPSREPADGSWLERISGDSPEMRKLRELAERAATAPESEAKPVLLLGPSGAGKELVARAIHELGRGRLGGPWVPINCAAFSHEMLEAELFGIEANTATGVSGRIGLWQLASEGGGTLFLNEVAELSPEHQAKILRALQEGEIRRVGAREYIRVKARVIADTNRDLDQMMARGRFRPDLYYRLARLVIRAPGLSERLADLEGIAQRLWRKEVTRFEGAALSPEIIELLRRHSWPGGVRELQGLLETLRLHFDVLDPRPEQLLEVWRSRPGAPSPRRDRTMLRVPATAPRPERELGPFTREALFGYVRSFRRLRPRYERFADVLREILARIAEEHAPLAIVQARAKPVASFAEKLQRRSDLVDPLAELRDLCGGRLIVQTEDQIRSVCAFLERYFDVEAGEAPSVSQEAASIPGYGAVQLSVRLDRERAEALAQALGVRIPEDVLGLWAELEVQTVLEHAWRHVSREMGHAEALPLPPRWRDELAGLAQILERIDESFSRIAKGFAAYRTSYPVQVPREEVARELEILENVLAAEPDPSVAVRLGKLAIAAGDFDRAIRVFEPHAKDGHQPALRDLGVALCQKHRKTPESALYARGQGFLERACAEPHRDPDAFASLAGTWKRRGRDDLARDNYRKAHEIDPADPYSLWGMLEADLVLEPELDPVALHGDAIRRAIERCRDHIAARVNLPWAFYDLGKFLLLLGDTHESLLASARAIEASTADFMIQTSLESLDRIVPHRARWPGLDDARALLALGRAVRFPSNNARLQLEKVLPARRKVTEPVVIVADGSAAFSASFRGTILSCGGGGLSEMLQAWVDVVGSGVATSEAALLVAGTGKEAALARGVAAALGARTVAADAEAIRASFASS